jgi:phosphate uptake regulator
MGKEMRRCGAGASFAVKNLERSAGHAYVHCNIAAVHKEIVMIAAIEKFFDALFAPLARELARMPASAFRYLTPGL